MTSENSTSQRARELSDLDLEGQRFAQALMTAKLQGFHDELAALRVELDALHATLTARPADSGPSRAYTLVVTVTSVALVMLAITVLVYQVVWA